MSKIPEWTIAIDFDGTVVMHDYPRIGLPVPDAIHYIKKLQEAGARLILWTMRCDGSCVEEENYLDQAVEYLKSNGIELFGINCNPEQHEWTGSPKAYAHIYVDDAAFGCPLIHPGGDERPYADWSKIGPALLDIVKSKNTRW